MSLSARRAWIEIPALQIYWLLPVVALRKESVDRNNKMWGKTISRAVALRKESVDRNKIDNTRYDIKDTVALRKESVDRNPYVPLAKVRHCEVALRKESVDRNKAIILAARLRGRVALRKESVDRNPYVPLAKVRHCESLSARRAWIEITTTCCGTVTRKSLSARRAWIEMCQSPQATFLG